MSEITLNLANKETKFIQEAIQYYVDLLEEKTQANDISDDDYSEIKNDIHVYEGILAYIDDVLAKFNP